MNKYLYIYHCWHARYGLQPFWENYLTIVHLPKPFLYGVGWVQLLGFILFLRVFLVYGKLKGKRKENKKEKKKKRKMKKNNFKLINYFYILFFFLTYLTLLYKG